MSDTNRVGLRIAANSNDEVPISVTNLNALRITGTPNLAYSPQTIVSNEIRPDRQISDLIPVGAEAGGDVAFEWSYGTFDDLIEAGMRSTWNNTLSEASDPGTANQIPVADETAYQVGHIVQWTPDDPDVDDRGDGVYVISDNSNSGYVIVSPYNSDTDAIDGTEGTGTVRIVGYRPATADAFDLDNTGTLTDGTAVNFSNLMGGTNNLVPGQWLKLSSFTADGNNVWIRITAINTTAGTISFDPPTGMVTTTGDGSPEMWFGDYIVNGSTDVTAAQFAVERRFEDHSPVTRELFLAMAISEWSVEAEPQSILTGSMTFFGQNSEVSDDDGNSYDDIYGTLPTDVDASDTEVYNTSSNVGRLGRGVDEIDAAGKNFVTNATINVSNNLRRRPAVGVFGASGIGTGEFSVTGDLAAYFDDKSLLEEVLNGTETSFDMTVISNDKQAITWDLPTIKFSDGAPDVPGKNEDVTIPLTYQAIKDDSLGYTMLVQRSYYVV